MSKDGYITTTNPPNVMNIISVPLTEDDLKNMVAKVFIDYGYLRVPVPKAVIENLAKLIAQLIEASAPQPNHIEGEE